MQRIDLNADLGEGGDDQALLQVVTSANIACGGHAGSPDSLRTTLLRCAERGVCAGAHPSWPDRAGFGRTRRPDADPQAAYACVLEQLREAMRAAADTGVRLEHVKVHGALANQAAEREDLAIAIGRAIVAAGAHGSLGGPLVWLTMAGTWQQRAAAQLGVPWRAEAFADRAYTLHGLLLDRRLPGAVLDDPPQVAARAVEMVARQALPLADGSWLAAPVDSLCVHGDTPGALAIAQAVRDGLRRHGFALGLPPARRAGA